MRKYILFIVFLLLIPVYLFATDGVSTVEHPAKVNSVATPDKVNTVEGLAAAGGDCQPGITAPYDFGYGADYTDDTDKACLDDGNSTLDGTITGATISDAQANSGTYSILIDNDEEKVKFTPNAAWINDTQGFFDAHIYKDLDVAAGERGFIMELTNEATATSNGFLIHIEDGEHLYVRHEGNNVVVSFITTATVPLDAWCHIQVRWRQNAGTDEIEARVCADNTCDTEDWEAESDEDTLTAFSAGEDSFCIGEEALESASTSPAPVYIDDIKIWATYAQD